MTLRSNWNLTQRQVHTPRTAPRLDPLEKRGREPARCELVLFATPGRTTPTGRRSPYDVPRRHADVDADEPRRLPASSTAKAASPKALRELRQYAHEYMKRHPKGHVTIEYHCKGKEVLLTTCSSAKRNMICQNHIKNLPALAGLSRKKRKARR